jgi:hypothetical protein
MKYKSRYTDNGYSSRSHYDKPVTKSSLLNGLVAYWNLDETSGNRVNAFGTGDLTELGSVSYRAGKIGNAATFGTGATNIGLSTASLAMPDTTNGLTISMWLRRDMNASATSGYWLSGFDLADVSHIPFGVLQFSQGGSYKRLRMYVEDTTGVQATIMDNSILSNMGQYQHVVAYYNPNTPVDHGVLGYWLDALPRLQTGEGESRTAVPQLKASTRFALGNAPGTTSSGSWPGSIDEVGVWNRMLTQAEVDALYNQSIGLTYPF